MARIGQPAYLYYFSYPPRGEYARLRLGSFHSMELSFVAGGYFRESRWGKPTDDDLRMLEIMTGYWTRFVTSGDPNGAGHIPWERYDPSLDRAMEFGNHIGMVPAPGVSRFSIFDRILEHRLKALQSPK